MLGPHGADLLRALACGLVMIAIGHLLIMERAEWFVFDRLTQWTVHTRPLDPSLAIVAIDDKSIQELGAIGKTWPWPRSTYADMITFLRASRAREIWIDLTFETPDAESFRDDEVRAAAAAAGNVRFGLIEGSRSIFQPTFDVTLPPTTTPVIHYDLHDEHLLAWPPPFNTLMAQPGGPVTPAAPLISEGEKLLQTLPTDDRTDPTKIATLWRMRRHRRWRSVFATRSSTSA